MRRLFLLICISFLSAASVASAQNHGTGLYEFGSFDAKGFDTINLGNLNTHFTIPIVSKTGRGENFQYSLDYEGLVWSPTVSSGAYTWQPNESSPWGFIGANSSGTIGTLVVTSGYNSSLDCSPVYSNFTYYDPAGKTHIFNYMLACPWGVNGQPYTIIGDGSTSDGSGLYIVYNSTDNIFTIYNRSGSYATFKWSQLGINKAVLSSTTDPNGNTITYNLDGTITDTLGVTALAITGVGNAVSHLVYTYPVTLQADQAPTAAVTVYFKTYTVATHFQCPNIGEAGATNYDLVDHITYSTGASYSIQYEVAQGVQAIGYGPPVTGRLASVTLPTGGTISYQYSGGCNNSGINPDGTPAILTRTTTDGSKTYSRTISGNSSTTAVTDELQNQSTYSFISNTYGQWFETERKIWQGSASGAPLQDRITQYNAQTTPSQLTTAITQTNVLESFNGGSQSTTINTYDPSTLLLTNSTVKSGANTLFSNTLTYSSGNLAASSESDGNSVFAKTTYGYNEYTSNPLIPTSSIPQHGSAGTNRGNLTSTHVLLLNGSGSIDSVYKYYDTGVLASATTPNGTTTYSYDPTQGFVTGMTLPTPSSGVALSNSAQYDVLSGAQLSSTGMNPGQTMQVTQYERLLRPVTVTFPDGGQTTYTYNSNSTEAVSKIDSSRNADQLTIYDSYGRTSRTATYNGTTWYLTDSCYDAAGRLQYASTPYAAATTAGAPVCAVSTGSVYSYDALNRVTNVANPDGTSSSASYNSRAVEQSNSQGIATITQYDMLGRTSAICELSASSSLPASGTPTACGMDIAGTGFVTTFAYDLSNHKTTVTQGAQQRVFQTDAAGRTTYTSEPERGATTYSYSYNSTGLVVSRQRPKANQSSASVLTATTIQYDSIGRVVSISYNDGITPMKNFQYDQAINWQIGSLGSSKGQLTYAFTSSPAAGTQFAYDSMGRVTQTLQCLPGRCGTTVFDIPHSYTYDYAGDLIMDSYWTGANSGQEIDTSYSVTTAGETSSISNTLTGNPGTPNGTVLANIQNGPGGPTNFQYGNGLSGVMNYDTMNRPSAMWLCANSSSSGCSGGTQLYATSATVSGAQVTSLTDSVLNTSLSLGYDEFNRLTSANASNGAGSFSWTYDRYGNRWAQNLTQGSGLAQSISFSPYTNQSAQLGYDAAGNVVSDGFHQYTYDAEGNVVTVDGGSTAVYSYDAMNERVQVTSQGFTTQYAFGLNGQRVSSWDGIACAPTLLSANTYWNGTPVSVFDGYQSSYQHQDLLGTKRFLTGSDGSVIGASTSLPFGDGLNLSGSDTDPYHFAGLDHDAESGTEHASFRQYSSTFGRWMSPDPFSGSYDFTNPQSLNRYTYALNNPLSMVDPSGLDECANGNPMDDTQALCNGNNNAIWLDDSTTCLIGTSGVECTNPAAYAPIEQTVTVTAEPDQAQNVSILMGLTGQIPGTDSIGGSLNNGPGKQVSQACQATLLNMVNNQYGTNFTSDNITGNYFNGTAGNILIDANVLTASQFNSIQLGRYTTYSGQWLIGYGLAGHVANEPSVDPRAVFSNSNIGGNLSVHFAYHDDHGYAYNPFGALLHLFLDVLSHNSRNQC